MNAAARKVSGRNASKQTQPTTLVYGLGGTGLSIARYMKRCGIDALYLDSRAAPPGLAELQGELPNADVVLGELPGDRIDGIDRVIVSPGIPETDPNLRKLRAAGADILSDIDLFVAEARCDYVAVTGSNGKSTVTTLIALMCEAGGLDVLAGGNLGRAALDLLAEPRPDLYVLELSSFQLQRSRRLPATVAVLLNVSPDHLDWHTDEAEYRAAKYRIFDEAHSAVFNRDDPVARASAQSLPGLSFGLDAPRPGQYGLVVEDGLEYLARGDQLLLQVDDLALVGRHNLANALAAMAASELVGVRPEAMLRVLTEFAGLPHRMQFVRELDGVRYINDSKATNVGAAIASVQSVDGPVVLLAGGQGKGGDFDHFAASVADRLRAAILFGEDGGLIADAFGSAVPTVRMADMFAALAEARSLAKAGDTVLLAPACASFDQFENYGRRGDAFCAAVGRLSA
jgi:UDP-N-acetylmuramoylalanine--D-glutamate ligase